MFKIKLNRAIQCPTGDKAIMRVGIHNIDDETFSHWFIQGLLHQGDIEIINGQTDFNPIKIPNELKMPKYELAEIVEVIPPTAKKQIKTVIKEPEPIIEEVNIVEVKPAIEEVNIVEVKPAIEEVNIVEVKPDITTVEKKEEPVVVKVDSVISNKPVKRRKK